MLQLRDGGLDAEDAVVIVERCCRSRDRPPRALLGRGGLTKLVSRMILLIDIIRKVAVVVFLLDLGGCILERKCWSRGSRRGGSRRRSRTRLTVHLDDPTVTTKPISGPLDTKTPLEVTKPAKGAAHTTGTGD